MILIQVKVAYSILCLLLLPLNTASDSSPPFLAPHFPPFFTVDVRITSHLLTPDMQTDGYPPSVRQLHLSYNRDSGVARIDEGIVTYIRRFDLKQEFKINSGPYPSCRTSYLSEHLPLQQFARGGRWITTKESESTILTRACPVPYEQKKCVLWQQDEGGGQIVHVYVFHETWIPLIAILHATNPATSTLEPTLTFEWTNLNLQQPADILFVDVSKTRDDCEDQAGGFPWIHLFHHFFRV